MEESDKIKEDFEDIKKRIRELEKEVDKKIKKDKETYEKKDDSIKESDYGNKKYVRILVILVIIILVVDIIGIIVYYKPDFSSFFKPAVENNGSTTNSNGTIVKGKCSDGTKEGLCSANKPYFCYEGNLVKKAMGCGCPAGYKIDFQDCKEN